MLEDLPNDLLFDLAADYCTRVLCDCCGSRCEAADFTSISRLLRCSKTLQEKLTRAGVVKSVLRRVAKTNLTRHRHLAREGHGNVLRAYMQGKDWRFGINTTAKILYNALFWGNLGYARLILDLVSAQKPKLLATLNDYLAMWKLQFITFVYTRAIKVCEELNVKISRDHIFQHGRSWFPCRQHLWPPLVGRLLEILERPCFAPGRTDDLSFEWAIVNGQISVCEMIGSRRCPVNDLESSRFDLVCVCWCRDKMALLTLLARRGDTPDLDQYLFAIENGSPDFLPKMVSVKQPRDVRGVGTRCLAYALQRDKVEHLPGICTAFPVGSLNSEHLLTAMLSRASLCAATVMAQGVNLNARDLVILRTWVGGLQYGREKGDFLVRLISLGALTPDERIYSRTLQRDAHGLFSYLFQRDRQFHLWMSASDDRFRIFQSAYLTGLSAFGPRGMP